MEVDQQALNEFLEARKAAAERLSKQPLEYNPNVTYGSLLSPKELEVAAHVFSPDIGERAKSIYSPEDLEKYRTAIKWEERVKPYNRPPIEYDMNERHPEYQARLDSYNSLESQQLRGTDGDLMLPDGNMYNILDVREVDKRIKPISPIGLEQSREIAALGFDPSNELVFNNPSDGTAFRTKVGLAPRKMTVEDYKFIGEQHGLDGTYAYVSPSKPSLGVTFRAKGSEDAQIINNPRVTSEDIYKFLIQEAPAISGDIALTVYGAGKLSTPRGMTGGLIGKTGKLLGMSGLSALGATGGDYLRLIAGKKAGAHDRSDTEMLKESGLVGAMSFAGTAAIGLATATIRKIYKSVFNQDVPPSVLEQIDDAYKAARQTDSAGPGMLYGDDTSVQQIRTQLDMLGAKFETELGGKSYNPTVPEMAGTRSAADLETVFLKYADDPELREMYNEIRGGNQEVIDEFVRVIVEKIGPDITEEVTGASVSEGLRVMAQRDIDSLTQEAQDMIDVVRMQVGGADDAAVAGQVLLRQVDNPEASSGPLFERQQTRLQEIKKGYLEPYNKAWNDAVNNPEYAELTTGAGATRKGIEKWLNQRKGDANALFRSSNADESVRALYEMLPTGPQNTLNRLRGRSETGGKFESPNFTLDELNSARVALNDFASNLPEGKQTIVKLARTLERGLEEQMNQLVREGASKKFGIPLTQKVKLNKKIQETGYGDDLRQAWSSQKEALELSNSQAIRSILQQRPEKVAEYLFNTTAKGSKTNTPVTELMSVLRNEGSDEIKGIQEGLAAYIQREVLEVPGKSPKEIATAYRTFVKENEGTLRAVFGDEQFGPRFFNPKAFNNKVVGGIQKLENDIKVIEARFGMAQQGNPDTRVTNIVESILATGETQKQSGRILEDIEYLARVIEDNPELQQQVAQVTKRYLLQDIMSPRAGGGFEINPEGLNRLLKEGFGPAEVTGPRLTFDSFFIPLLGKQDGKELIKNLNVLNSMVQRQVGVKPSEGISRVINAGEYAVGSNIEGARMLQRLLIAPLTQLGRRVGALSTRQAENSRKLIGEMLLDEKLFKEVVRMAEGRETTAKFIRFLTSYGTVAAQDIGSEFEYYNTEEKDQQTPEKKPLIQREVMDLYNFAIPEEI